MRHTLLTIVIGLSLVGCGNQESTQSPASQTKSEEVAASSLPAVAVKSQTEKLNQWFEQQFETELMMSPMSLTSLGRKDRYGEIDDMSEAAEIEQLEWKRNSVLEMKDSFDYEQLSDEAKLSYDLWEYQYEQAAKGAEFRRSRYVFTQMSGVHAYLPTFLMSFHKVDSLEDMQAYISRISELGRAMNQLVDRAKLNASEGIRPPRFAYEVVRDEARAIISG
ncbi:MAG: DUF885 family protein, partial [Arenicella sp.]|nr:DUF885 family protein [Arenicella sp.]